MKPCPICTLSNMKNEPHNLKHGHARSGDKPASITYVSYSHASGRCNNPQDDAYVKYGGRGIEFRFASFQEFLTYIGPRPSREYSLDRYPNPNGHYEPGNVRWATKREQILNRDCMRLVTVAGESLPMREWSTRLGLAPNTVRERLVHGWCETCAVTIPKVRGGNGQTCAHQ